MQGITILQLLVTRWRNWEVTHQIKVKGSDEHSVSQSARQMVDDWTSFGDAKRKLHGRHHREVSTWSPQMCCWDAIEIWGEQAHPPPTWGNIIEAVEFLKGSYLGEGSTFFSQNPWLLPTSPQYHVYTFGLQFHLYPSKVEVRLNTLYIMFLHQLLYPP